MANNYFNEALGNFISEYAYKEQARHLYNLGYSLKEIKDRLDYPVSLSALKDYLWEYLVSSKQIVYKREDIPEGSSKQEYVQEYDAYGRKSFRLKGDVFAAKIDYTEHPIPNNISDIPNLTECYILINGAELVGQSESLSESFLLYLSDFSWPNCNVYLKLNKKSAEILVASCAKGFRPKEIVSPFSHELFC